MHELEQVNSEAFDQVMQPFSDLNRLERQLNQAGKIAKKTALATAIAGGLTIAANQPALAAPAELSYPCEINWKAVDIAGATAGAIAFSKEILEAYKGKRAGGRQLAEAFLNLFGGYAAGAGAAYLVQTGTNVLQPENHLALVATVGGTGYVLGTINPLLWFRQKASSLGAIIKDREQKDEQAAINRDIKLILDKDPEAESAHRRLEKKRIKVVHRGGLITPHKDWLIFLNERGEKTGEQEYQKQEDVSDN